MHVELKINRLTTFLSSKEPKKPICLYKSMVLQYMLGFLKLKFCQNLTSSQIVKTLLFAIFDKI
jgi:hypothetical protein